MKVVIIRGASRGINGDLIAQLLGETVSGDVRRRVSNFMYVSFRDFWPIWKIFIFRDARLIWSKKVMKSRFSLYKLQWEIIRKSWDFGTFLTSDRPIITKNEKFSNRSKIPERYIHEVSNALPHAFKDHLSEKCRNFHFIDPPSGTSYNNYLHM